MAIHRKRKLRKKWFLQQQKQHQQQLLRDMQVRARQSQTGSYARNIGSM